MIKLNLILINTAFSSGDLNKYQFLTRKDLKYKLHMLDKARFEFSPLGKAFRTGLDRTAEGYQEEGVIKLLKDIRDGLRNGRNGPDNDNNDDNDDNDDNDMPDLETEEDAAKRIASHYDYLDKINLKMLWKIIWIILMKNLNTKKTKFMIH